MKELSAPSRSLSLSLFFLSFLLLHIHPNKTALPSDKYTNTIMGIVDSECPKKTQGALAQPTDRGLHLNVWPPLKEVMGTLGSDNTRKEYNDSATRSTGHRGDGPEALADGQPSEVTVDDRIDGSVVSRRCRMGEKERERERDDLFPNT